jgi:hypothetical protein
MCHFAAARRVELCFPVMGTEMHKPLFDIGRRYADIYCTLIVFLCR